MSAVLLGIYMIYTSLNRFSYYVLMTQTVAIVGDIDQARSAGQYQLHSLDAIPDANEMAFFGWSIMTLSMLVWAGAVYFMVGARRR